MIQRLTRLAPVIAAVLGTLAALLVAILPEWRLVALVEALHLPSILSAARPPLGATARTLLAVVAGGLVGGGLFMAFRAATRLVPAPREDGVPVLRRADAHPDAPARRPIRASEDLGAPLPIGAPAEPAAPAMGSPLIERTLPADLDTPLAALDPAAIPAAPREPVRPVAPLAKPVVEETFDLVPIRRTARTKREPVPTTVSGLLDRLERSAGRGAKPQPTAEGLGLLRGLAVR
jgi:hypothetical protein